MMESIAKTYLPTTTTMPIGTQMEIQINNIGYLYQCISNDAPSCKWKLIETNQIGEKRGPGRPRKTTQPDPAAVERKIGSCNVYTASEIEKIQESTELQFTHNEEIDGVQYPVFNKPAKLTKRAKS
jgi:hypothetical protein